MGQSPKSDTYNDTKNGLPLLNGAADFRGSISPSKWTSNPKKVANPGDYIFGVRATIGLTTKVFNKFAIGRGTGAATSIESELDEFLYFALQDLFTFYSNSGSGTVYVNISKSDFENYQINLPDKSYILDFHNTVAPLMKLTYASRNEIRRLQTMRDIILPKLMSGEVLAID